MKIGDIVRDKLTGKRGHVVNEFMRDGVRLVEVATAEGETTTAAEVWFETIGIGGAL